MKEKAKILVVDDEHGVRQSFNMVLKDLYNVLLSGTGQEALDIFIQKKKTFNVFFEELINSKKLDVKVFIIKLLDRVLPDRTNWHMACFERAYRAQDIKMFRFLLERFLDKILQILSFTTIMLFFALTFKFIWNREW